VSRRSVLVLRVVAGLVFVVFGAGKFVNHASEAASFAGYGLPWPDAFTDAVGAIEILGGLALLGGVALGPAAAVLAGDMVGAIVISGLLRWEWISLTLAPVLLAGMLALLHDQRSPRSMRL
jgi:putative oxidoreductase